ncbi:MAG: Sapep family Mn(2+)-dependent dipeptidase, partial [Erysipelotrichaceae bacterium]|nr:Sapep family Mn(2+)-dependent dipeptidase [Erysipelotrichaceae bacterium]
ALDVMLELGKRDGFETENVDGYAGVIRCGDGQESVGILGHLDIVPVGDGWTKDPLKVTVEDGYVFGRGVLDDKGPLLAAYYALKLVREAGIPLKRKVMLIAGCDEESGMECMEYYADHGEIPTLGFTPDADFPVIYGEKGSIHMSLHSHDKTVIRGFSAGSRPNIVIQKADAVVDADDPKEELFDFYLRTNGLTGSISKEDDGVHLHMEGVPAHGASPYLGINAGVHLLNFIGEAYGDQLARDYYELLKDWKGTPEGIMTNGVYMGFLTMNPGIIELKDGDLHALIDIRYPNDVTPEFVLKGFETAAAARKSEIQAVMDHAGSPLFVDPESELVVGLMNSYRKYTGDEFTPPITIGGGTYAKKFDNFVAFGPEKIGEEKTTDAFVGGCHQKDEGVKLDDLLEAMAIYADAIVNLAG